jgi:hypothetical protein
VTLRLTIANGSAPSGAIMAKLLADRGVPAPASHRDEGVKAYVSWGAPVWRAPAPLLNARPERSKLEELKLLTAGGVAVPAMKEALEEADFTTSALWYARKLLHKGGTDLRAVTQPDEAEWRKAAGWAYFTARVPIKRELRCWVFRGKLLGCYEKAMRRPEEYTGLGRNHKYGFVFSRLQDGCETSEAATATTDQALTALGLDFGAADLIQKPDGSLVCLEVNTAPGIENERRLSANKLADCIAEWYRGL